MRDALVVFVICFGFLVSLQLAAAIFGTSPFMTSLWPTLTVLGITALTALIPAVSIQATALLWRDAYGDDRDVDRD